MIWALHCIHDRCKNIAPWATASNVTLAKYLVLRMLPTTWWILSKIAFSCEFFIVVHVGFTGKYWINGIELLLNSEPLSKITLRSLGYLDSHTSLNIWYIIAEDWSMIGNSVILNHPVSGLIKFMHSNYISFMSILLSGCLTLDSIVYVPMRSTHTACHGIKFSSYLAGSNPYLTLRLLNWL